MKLIEDIIQFYNIFKSYKDGVEGTAAMQVMRALHTPLHEMTLGSG